MVKADRYSNRPGSSSRWGLMKRMVLRRADGVIYLHRTRIVQTPWFGIYLHRMDGPDPGRDLHDHPWPFITFILRGGYREHRAPAREAGQFADAAERWPATCAPGVVQVLRQGNVRRMRIDECHAIFELLRVPTRTLVFTGRRVRNWGFFLPPSVEPFSYVKHDIYDFYQRRELTVQEDGNVEHRG